MKSVPNEMLTFYERAKNDHRIGPVHISLYMAILFCWLKNNCAEPVCFNSALVMNIAKISSRATYTRCIHDLDSYAYIRYVATNNPFCGCSVYLKNN